jgi:hypothetical protein
VLLFSISFFLAEEGEERPFFLVLNSPLTDSWSAVAATSFPLLHWRGQTAFQARIALNSVLLIVKQERTG